MRLVDVAILSLLIVGVSLFVVALFLWCCLMLGCSYLRLSLGVALSSWLVLSICLLSRVHALWLSLCLFRCYVVVVVCCLSLS